MSKLSFQIEYPSGSGTWNTIIPTIEDFVISKERKDGQQFYRLNQESELVLKDAAWTFIKDKEENYHCVELPIRVICGVAPVTIYEGLVNLTDGDYDYWLCQAKIKSETNDEYTCLEQDIKKDANILNSASKVTLKPFIGTIETTTCPPVSTNHVTGLLPVNPPEDNSCLTGLDGWVVIENHFTDIETVGTGPPWTAEHRTVWARLKVTSVTQPPGIGWISIGANEWVKAPETVFNYETSGSPPSSPLQAGAEWHQYYDLVWASAEDIDNGVLLSDALDYMLDVDGIDCPLTVVSNFFSINRDFTNPTNDEYTSAIANLDNLIIFQKSDVKRANVSNNATLGNINFEELFETFADMFQVFPSIEGSTLRLEHITYYLSKPVSLDLTLPIYEDMVKQTRRYSYKTDKSPRYEKFSWMDNPAISVLFKGVDVIYGAACANKEQQVVEHRVSRFSTDLANIINFPDSFDDDGFVLVSAVLFNSAYYAISEISELNGTSEVLNGHLSFPNLQENYWKKYRYQESGLMNNVTTVFTTRPNRVVVPITLTGWCCSDFRDFDPNTLITHFFGDCEIEKVTYSVKNGTVTLSLVF